MEPGARVRMHQPRNKGRRHEPDHGNACFDRRRRIDNVAGSGVGGAIVMMIIGFIK
jgi:hypothetical protein